MGRGSIVRAGAAGILAACVMTAAAVPLATGALAADPPCWQERQQHSQNSNTPAILHFINKNGPEDGGLRIYWLDYQGKRVLYKTLYGQENWIVNTYVTHPWVVAQFNWEASLLCEQIIMPEAPLRVVVVGGYPEE